MTHYTERELNQVIRLFHEEIPASANVEEIRFSDDDSRWVIFIENSAGKYVIKAARNGFTNAERINAWPSLINTLASAGCYSPGIIRGLNGEYAQNAVFGGRDCVVWEEEFAKYTIANDDIVRDTYANDIIEIHAKIAAMGIDGFPGVSGWSRFTPFGADETQDEVQDCFDEFDAGVNECSDDIRRRWAVIRQIWLQNRDRLAAIYHALPRSAYQGDWNALNVLLDENGSFKGLIDYNLAGEDVNINIFMSMLLFGFSWVETATPEGMLEDLNRMHLDKRMDKLLDRLKLFRSHYKFCEDEVVAAKMLFRYIYTVGYSEISALNEYKNDAVKLNLLMDYIEYALTAEYDFRSAMLL